MRYKLLQLLPKYCMYSSCSDYKSTATTTHPRKGVVVAVVVEVLSRRSEVKA